MYIHMSQKTYDELRQNEGGDIKHLEGTGLQFEKRGEGMEIKGKGWMQTYCLKSRRDEAENGPHVAAGSEEASALDADGERGARPAPERVPVEFPAEI